MLVSGELVLIKFLVLNWVSCSIRKMVPIPNMLSKGRFDLGMRLDKGQRQRKNNDI